MNDEQRLRESRDYWDREAETFDVEPDHGLRDPVVRQAWRDLLKSWLPSTKSAVLDSGCGTGSLSLLIAELGHEVMGIDTSPAMIVHAKAKAIANQQEIRFEIMDAACPSLTPQLFDVLICRHLLWALPKPNQVLQRWAKLLTPTGRLVLIEGFWHTGAGLHAQEIINAMPSLLHNAAIHNLSDQPELWGGKVADERYAIVASR